jgi:hypothetical protein
MLISGQADYESERIVRLSNNACMTSEMDRGPISKHGHRPRRADSSHGDSGRAAAPMVARRLHYVIARSNAGL